MEPTPLTFAVYAEQWVARLPLLDLAPATREGYVGLTRRHLMPLFGETLLSQLTRPAIRNGWLSLRGRGKTITTIRNAYVALSSCLAEAVEEGLLDHNPAHGSTKRLWKGPLCPPKPILASTEWPEFLETVRAVCAEHEDLFVLLLGAGLRIGEALGLQAEDVDPSRPLLAIRRKWNRHGYGPVKGRRERTVEIPAELGARLRARAVRLGRVLFPSPRHPGQPYSYDVIHERMQRIVARLGNRVGLHGIRHSYATFLLETTGDLMFTQFQLGHSSPTITAGVYGQAAKPRRPEALDRLHRAFADDAATAGVEPAAAGTSDRMAVDRPG